MDENSWHACQFGIVVGEEDSEGGWDYVLLMTDRPPDDMLEDIIENLRDQYGYDVTVRPMTDAELHRFIEELDRGVLSEYPDDIDDILKSNPDRLDPSKW